MRTTVTDYAYANMPESRRKAVILWEMIGKPMGYDGIRILKQAVEQATDEQIRNTLRYLQHP